MGKADLRSRSHQGRRSTPRAAAGRARKTSSGGQRADNHQLSSPPPWLPASWQPYPPMEYGQHTQCRLIAWPSGPRPGPPPGTRGREVLAVVLAVAAVGPHHLVFPGVRGHPAVKLPRWQPHTDAKRPPQADRESLALRLSPNGGRDNHQHNKEHYASRQWLPACWLPDNGCQHAGCQSMAADRQWLDVVSIVIAVDVVIVVIAVVTK